LSGANQAQEILTRGKFHGEDKAAPEYAAFLSKLDEQECPMRMLTEYELGGKCFCSGATNRISRADRFWPIAAL
jgi:hypothetical protein